MAGTMMQPAAAGDASPPDAGMEPQQKDPCSLTGRWLVTVHYVTDSLGQLQYCHTYLYYDIEQTADSLVVKKGLHCGDDAVASGDLAANIDFSKSWTAVAGHVVHAGRKGTSVAAGDGCKVDLEKMYTVRGATIPYYLDPSKPLPSAENPAMGSTPGWEDWDMDGNPGVSGNITGVVSGTIFVAPRQWTQMSGTVSDASSVFKLPITWDQEANVMSYDGSPLLSSMAVRAADASLHFAQFARLASDQATGDDTAICGSVTQLAKTLTPEASGM